MQKTITRFTLALAALMLAATGLWAQTPQKVSVPFKFFVNNVPYEAGTYYVVQQAQGARLELRDARQKPLVQVPVMTRLAAKNGQNTGSGTRLVFDELPGENHHLAEVWMAGMDGFLVRVTQEKHTHDVVPSTEMGSR